MSTPFVGIDNVNEFYGEHYLAAILASDLKGTLARWREQREEESTPPRALAGLHQRFFRLQEKLRSGTKNGSRLGLLKEWWDYLLNALGYQPGPVLRQVLGGQLPVLAELRRQDGTPLLWWVPAFDPAQGGGSPLDLPIWPELLTLAPADTGGEVVERVPPAGTLADAVTLAFGLEEPPRFILVVGQGEVLLLERARWAEQRLLRFDLEDILGRREKDTLDVTACLLHKECLAPGEGAALLDSLDDSSYKHAYGVSEDLKFALRECIELLGNEAARQIADQAREKKDAIPWDELADPLSRECLQFMYRLLFLFYVEARPDLGYAPMGAAAYLKGYSLERLRDIELDELLTDEARNGTYLHESLELLFRMVFEGAEPHKQLVIGPAPSDQAESLVNTFRIQPLRSHLFDPVRTPMLSRVRFPNHVLQRVVELMSLSRGRLHGGRGRRGRVSYATLGINQLGAVYEALLSFRGFFAREDLFEVKPAKDGEGNKDRSILDTAYFVNEADLKSYSDAERVFDVVDGVKKLRKYIKGAFIYRMAGRDRQRSASYYTPAVLTRAVVKYALQEVLLDGQGQPKLKADEILGLKVLEPAVGSAAFLNEAVDQLADAYLLAKQKELGARIPHDRYAWEKQRVKMYLADNNVFGIDLNPVAVELGWVSLWLNAIFGEEPGKSGGGVFVPWFGMQLVCGNSLVGARRQAFLADEVGAGVKGKAAPWLEAVPTRVPLGTTRPEGAVWHFLLPDQGMASYAAGKEGEPIRELCTKEIALIKKWKGEACAPLEEGDYETLQSLSAAVDKLWARHVEGMQDVRRRTTDPLSVYGRTHPEAGTRPATTTADKDRIYRGELASEGIRASSPYRRLKLAMDYWCALWFWPIEQAHLMPSRQEWLIELAALLDYSLMGDVGTTGDPQGDLFAPTMPVEKARKLIEELGQVDVPALVRKLPRLQVVQELAEQYRFFHWELEFADVFVDHGGFDLVVGNPPWIPIEWKEADVLGDADPIFVLRDLSSKAAADRRAATFEKYKNRSAWLAAHEEAASLQQFLSATQNYAEVRGSKTNLFKCFLPRAWAALKQGGAAGFLHPESLYDEANGGALRAAAYPRLRRHYQFSNEGRLFPEVHHSLNFSINIYGAPRDPVHFETIANLYAPGTIDECLSHSGQGPIPGIKDEHGDWEIRGHKARRVEVGTPELELFATMFDEEGTLAAQARIPALHSPTFSNALRTMRDQCPSLEASGVIFHPTYHFDESRQVKDGTIRRETCFPQNAGELVLNGPHLFVGNPLYKTPRRVCTLNSHYDVIDLTTIPDDYLPRTNYVPACSPTEYIERSPKVPWGEPGGIVVTNSFFRVVVRRALGSTSARTLLPALAVNQPAHVHTVYSYTFQAEREAVLACASWMALPIDFLVKASGAADFFPSLAKRIPIVRGRPFDSPLVERTLVLNCLTSFYSDLWSRMWQKGFLEDSWASEDDRLPRRFFRDLKSQWQREVAIRTDFARRQVLVEIDVLVALAVGISLDQLLELYRIQFPVLQQNEADTWYDQTGRIVSTCSTGLPGVGLPRGSKGKKVGGPCWEDVKDMQHGAVEREVEDDTLPGGPHKRVIKYVAPFTTCNREEDYRVAWAEFSKRYGVGR